jgi:hypothetical protein
MTIWGPVCRKAGSIWQIKKAGFSLRTKNEHMNMFKAIVNFVRQSFIITVLSVADARG